MYYHVLIEKNEKAPKSSHNISLYEYNKPTLDIIIEDILVPYFSGESFVFEGYYFTKKDIARIKVFESDLDSKHYGSVLASRRARSNIIDLGAKKSDFLYHEELVRDITKEAHKIANEKIKDVSKINSAKTPEVINNINVFIVHGHNEQAKVEVARFVEKLGFIPIILHEQTSGGKTIIEKIEAYSNVGFGIVLYTPCDIGAVITDKNNLQPRARQNVVFEHGYLIGKLGRDKVCALVKDTVETPNDISGVVFVEMDLYQAWHIKLAKELKAAGYEVDMNKL